MSTDHPRFPPPCCAQTTNAPQLNYYHMLPLASTHPIYVPHCSESNHSKTQIWSHFLNPFALEIKQNILNMINTTLMIWALLKGPASSNPFALFFSPSCLLYYIPLFQTYKTGMPTCNINKPWYFIITASHLLKEGLSYYRQSWSPWIHSPPSTVKSYPEIKDSSFLCMSLCMHVYTWFIL